MDRTQALGILRTSYAELTEATEAVERERVRVESMTSIVGGILKLFPDLAVEAGIAPDPGPRPEGQEAVIRILKEFPGQQFTVLGMVDALAERDWLPMSQSPGNAVRTALARAEAAEEHVKKVRMPGPGGPRNQSMVWVYAPPGAQMKPPKEEV
jgi:hypothetical protein